jgi:ferrochelatase
VTSTPDPATEHPYDALLILSFGGPEGPDDVMPFLENVLRGRNVPRERMLEVAEHYHHYGGVSPINQHCRDLKQALRTELDQHGIHLPLYWGNRNWHPFLIDTLREIEAAGHRRVLTYVTSGFSCYSGCRQYREDIKHALEELGNSELHVDKIRVFYNHPDFIQVVSEAVRNEINALQESPDGPVHVAFTAHSIPDSMAQTSDYVKQLSEACRLVAERLELPAEQWSLVYQSRSGRPQDPWLEPDILDHIQDLQSKGTTKLVISPIGFLSDHMEVMFDLDEEAAQECSKLEISMRRASCPGHSPQFVTMIRKLIEERISGAEKECIGFFGPNHDRCPEDCCPAPVRRRPAAASS